MKGQRSKVCVPILLLMIVSCGGSPPPDVLFSTSSCAEPCGVMSIVVKNAQSFNPNIEHGKIVKYRVTVSGPGIDTPVTAEFDGEETGGMIDGIPTGSDRQVIVEAINPNNLIIRQGEQAGVKIEGGKTADVEVTMESVPIFTNLADGSVVDNTRLAFQVFAEPGGVVAVEDATNNASKVLADVSTMSDEINLDVATGLGKMTPSLQPAGEHKFTVKNMMNGHSSTVTVKLVDGTKRKGAPFAAAAGNSATAGRRVSWGEN